MIYVDRSKVPVPKVLESDRVGHLYVKAAEHFRSKKAETAQTRFNMDLEVLFDPSVRVAVEELFHNKCAYCESPVETKGPGNIEHFRPSNGTVDLEGNYFHAHYWWLAFEWRNVYLACGACLQTKRNRFPVAGTRAAPESPYDKLINEQPVLVDPCIDRPGRIFVFDERGGIASESERGQITIEILGLNRTELTAARHRTFDMLQQLWQEWQKSKLPALQTQIMAMLQPDAEYSAMSRQFLLQWAWSRTGIMDLWNKFKSFFESLGTEHETVTTAKRRSTVKSYREYESNLEDFSLEKEATPSSLHLIDQTVERIEIKNLRAIQQLDVEIQSAGTDSAPWTVLLGENGTGKSTILQAVALAFAGAKYRSQLAIDAASYVRRGCKSGHIRIHVRGFTAPLELTFRNTGTRRRRLMGSEERPRIPILAYGATRLLPRPGIRSSDGTDYARVDNLFNPFVPLANASEWLLGLSDRNFHHAARSLKDILNLAPNVVLRKNRRRKRVEIPSLHVSSLTELSDGYQSVLALLVDIMMVMTRHFEAMEAATGIVLLDEIGAHLHPRWRMRVIRSLRTAFPNIQFIATTHEPLCLRGIRDGEVVVLKKGAQDKVYSVTDLPSVVGMRVEQLLTSEHFGLSSTVDPELEDVFERYYELLRRSRLNDREKKELEKLRQVLADHRVMGTTRRERLMLNAIDQHLATTAPADRGEASTRLSGDLEKLLEQVKF